MRLKTINYKNKIELIFLIALFIISVFTRFYHIDIQVLGMDEGATYYCAQMSFIEIIEWGEPNSPTFYVLERWITDYFGKTELSIKFISALLGAICVPITYLLARDATKSKNVAFIAAILVLFSPTMIYYSQEARGFSAAACLFVLQTWIFIHAIHDNNTKKWIVFAIVSAFGIHMQYVNLMPTAVMFLYAFLKNEHKIITFKLSSNIARSLLVLFILILPIFVSIINTFNTAMNYTDVWDSGLDFVKTFLFFSFYQTDSLMILMTLLFFVGSVILLKKQKDVGILFLSIILVPLAFLIAVSLFSHAHHRYLLFAIPLIFIIVAYPISIIKNVPSTSAIVSILCCVLIITTSVPILDYYYSGPARGNFKGATNILYEQAEEGDCIVYTPQWIEWGLYGCLSFYYDNEKEKTTVICVDNMDQMNTVLNDPKYGEIFILTWDSDHEVVNWAKTQTDTKQLFRCDRLTLFNVIE